MLTFIVLLLLVGLVAGAIARLLVPGRDPMGVIGTMVLGVLGSFVGGFIFTLIQFHTLSMHLHPTGLIGSIVGAIVLLIIRRLTGLGRRRARRA
ncbi:MAG TPA: GlsB/YeaQ/YmgE family stress response membrane protein [Streptosporangiaceae bacterium]|jgi:uncharacterized membrane protein YeaQ/YmgE (transglycosylase-associated protein family)|nr:GlsB/YeaQ/YmgE family stress response membrane protein [Streptosporangiaceae bacterium]